LDISFVDLNLLLFLPQLFFGGSDHLNRVMVDKKDYEW